eukprot:983131-Pelagomonas_calceolata.AAC.2
MGSSRRRLLACLTSSNGWELHLEHILGGPGGWGGGPNNCPILVGKWRETKAQHWVNGLFFQFLSNHEFNVTGEASGFKVGFGALCQNPLWKQLPALTGPQICMQPHMGTQFRHGIPRKHAEQVFIQGMAKNSACLIFSWNLGLKARRFL